MRIFLFAAIIFLIFIFIPYTAYANEYVLPYPSVMPGNRFYKISRIFDVIERWWYWGNIASIKYHLKLADKYLVEAKTLFEYRQYLLGVDALKQSNEQILRMHTYLIFTQKEKKDVKKLEKMIIDAMNVHLELLDKVSKDLPVTYQWTPEKQPATMINFSELFQEAKKIRMELLK